MGVTFEYSLFCFQVLYENGLDMRYICIMYASICLILIVFGTIVLIPSKDVLFYWIEEERLMGYDIFQDSIAGPDFVVNSYNLYKEHSITKQST